MTGIKVQETIGTLRKIPEGKKLCPLTFAAGNDEAPEFNICAEDKCEWWFEDMDMCTRVAGVRLYYLEMKSRGLL